MIYLEKRTEVWSKTCYKDYPIKAFYIYIAYSKFWVFDCSKMKNKMRALNFYKL